jgi:two-component system sensor histidine kinase UhpB
MIQRLRSLPARILLLVILPVILLLLAVALGGSALHTQAMHEMVALRDERSVRVAAAGLGSNLGSNPDPQEVLAVVETWLFEGGTPPQGAQLFLIDSQGRVIAHQDPSRIGMLVIDHPGVSAVLGGQTGSLVGVRPADGDEVVIAFSPLTGLGWAMVLVEAWDQIASPRVLYTQLAPLVLLPAFLLTGVIIYVGVRQIVQPLQRLDERATRLGWGDFGALEEPVGGIDEIRALHATLSRMANQLRAAQAGMRSYAAALLQGQEEERARLARELHDETVQTLIALEHRIHMVRRALQRDPATLEGRLVELSQMATDSVHEVRRVVRALRPLYLEDLGWLSAVRALAEDLDRRGDLMATFRLMGPERRLDPIQELALYRIAQEALNNVERHSDADQVEIRVTIGTGIEIIIEDNGVGFRPPDRPEELATAGHFGLVGMHERAQIIGARLGLESAPGRGTRVRINMPEEE